MPKGGNRGRGGGGGGNYQQDNQNTRGGGQNQNRGGGRGGGRGGDQNYNQNRGGGAQQNQGQQNYNNPNQGRGNRGRGGGRGRGQNEGNQQNPGFNQNQQQPYQPQQQQASHGFPQQQTQDYPGAQRTQPPYVQPTQTPPPVQSQPPGSAWGRSGGTGGGGAGSSGGAWGGRDTSGQGHPAAAQQVPYQQQQPQGLTFGDPVELRQPSASATQQQAAVSADQSVGRGRGRGKKNKKGGDAREALEPGSSEFSGQPGPQGASGQTVPGSSAAGAQWVESSSQRPNEEVGPAVVPVEQPSRPQTSSAPRDENIEVEDLETPSELQHFAQRVDIGGGNGTSRSRGNGMTPIRRPDNGGTFGQRVTLLTNHFEMRMENLPECYHYDIEIEPKMSADRKRSIFKQFLIEKMKLGHVKDKFVFDGQKNIYSCHKITTEQLPPKKTEMEFLNEETGRKFNAKITIQFAANVDLSMILEYIRNRNVDIEKPQQALNVLNTAYKQLCMGMANFVTLKRATFKKPTGRPIDLTGGLDLWFGYQPSVIMGKWKVYLQIDITSKGFTQETPMVDYVSNFFRRHPGELELDFYQMKNLTKALSGYKIKTTHLGYTKKIHDFKENAYKKIPDLNQTVEQYFKSQYNVQLKYPNLPLVRITPKEKDNCIPMEVCILKGEQPSLKKLDEEQQSRMVRETAMDPSRRNQMIMEKLNKETKPNSSGIFKQFNLAVSDQMAEIEGRVLPGPIMYGGNNRSVPADRGNYRSPGFAQPATSLMGYVVVCPRKLEEKIGPMDSSMSQEARKAGMNWPVNSPVRVFNIDDRNIGTVHRTLSEVVQMHKQQQNFNLVIIILFKKSADIYGMAKHVLDNEHQIASQVLLQRTISGRGPGQPPNPMSINQILLKINTKMAGINVRSFENYMQVIQRTGNYGDVFQEVAKQYADIFKEPFMVFGADVTHPDPGDHGKPSIAAVIGSLNSTLTRYGAQIRVQRSRQEMIEGMKVMFMNLLRKFREVNRGHTPKKILYYRDGVSEGQFSEVLIAELHAMQQACRELNSEYTPAITFIVVNKRHKARFFNWGRQKNGQNGIINVTPGTVVDVDIVHPFQFDFYLCSHEGIKGTSRPAHYHVLYDDSGFKSDTLQSFTYALCHLYARCTRAVSYPPPTYYAHHAAMRARHHVAHLLSMYTGSESAQSSGSGDSEGADPRVIEYLNQHLVPASDNLLRSYPMYFV